MTAAAAALAALAGLAGSVQVAVMGRFGGRVGVVEALAFATAIQLLLAVSILLDLAPGHRPHRQRVPGPALDVARRR